jgi:thymidine kinase
MGSGKSTVALQIHHNLREAGLRGMLLTRLDRSGGKVSSRLGVSSDAMEVTETMDIFQMASASHNLNYLVCDETQFYSPAQCDQLARVVDDLNVDIFAFGLLTDFRGVLFEGTKRLMEVADERVPMQVEARCWCGARATHNARLVNGKVVYEGDVVVVGDTDVDPDQQLFGDVVRYELLCRRHWRDGIPR